jgi:hypothetical protein
MRKIVAVLFMPLDGVTESPTQVPLELLRSETFKTGVSATYGPPAG